MEAHVINALLYREIKPGKEFEKLIPAYLQIDMNFEKENQLSDTYDTLQFMAKWTVKYAHQFEKLAQRLKGKNVLETVQNNYSFLYNHFQYRIDESTLDQTLYSLSGAWHYRKHGFDCKTFSLLASGLLLNQGIPHSFRKIKIDSDDWAHVYVVVPINKNQYTIIDATTKDNKEVRFIEKHDFDMTKYLKHRGIANPIAINALACPSTPSCGCKSSFDLGNPVIAIAYNGLDDIYGNAVYTTAKAALNSSSPGIFNFNSIKDIFTTPISCIGGSAFSGYRAETEGVKITAYFEQLIIDINMAVKNQDMNALKQSYTQLEGIIFTSIKAYKAKKAEGWNKCTTESITRMESILNFYEKVIFAGINGWLDMYFTSTKVGTKRFTNNNDFEDKDPNFFFTFTGPQITHDAAVKNFVLKQGVTAIPVFEFTPYVQQVASNPSSFNLQDLLGSFQKTLVMFSGSGVSNNNYTPGDDIYGNNQSGQQNTNTGMSTTTKLVGVGILAVSAFKLYKLIS